MIVEDVGVWLLMFGTIGVLFEELDCVFDFRFAIINGQAAYGGCGGMAHEFQLPINRLQSTGPLLEHWTIQALQRAPKEFPKIPEALECSFSADTRVATTAGEQAISALRIGDRVLGWNEALGAMGDYAVTAVLSHVDRIIEDLTVGGETVETTPEHPFYTEESGWVPAGRLWIGAHIYQADGGWGEVEGELQEQRPEVMYNLTVQTAHTFFVGSEQLLVHNDCPPPIPFFTCITAADLPQATSYIMGHDPGGFGNCRANPAATDDTGRAWVGDGYRVSRDGRAWISADESRIYRPPQFKPARSGTQANLTYKGPRGEVNAHIKMDAGC